MGWVYTNVYFKGKIKGKIPTLFTQGIAIIFWYFYGMWYTTPEPLYKRNNQIYTTATFLMI